MGKRRYQNSETLHTPFYWALVFFLPCSLVLFLYESEVGTLSLSCAEQIHGSISSYSIFIVYLILKCHSAACRVESIKPLTVTSEDLSLRRAFRY